MIFGSIQGGRSLGGSFSGFRGLSWWLKDPSGPIRRELWDYCGGFEGIGGLFRGLKKKINK